MKTVLILIAFSVSVFAQYETGKIDMHGGKEAKVYDKKKGFRNTSMGLSLFLDKNISTQDKKKKKSSNKDTIQ